jgi:hypothetical protein
MRVITYRLILSSFFAGILSSCVLLEAEREAPGNDDNLLAATIDYRLDDDDRSFDALRARRNEVIAEDFYQRQIVLS